MDKQVFTTTSPLVRKQRHSATHLFTDWIPQTIQALGDGVANSIRAANTKETITHTDVNVNENKKFSFTEIKSVGFALAAAAVVVAIVFLIKK